MPAPHPASPCCHACPGRLRRMLRKSARAGRPRQAGRWWQLQGVHGFWRGQGEGGGTRCAEAVAEWPLCRWPLLAPPCSFRFVQPRLTSLPPDRLPVPPLVLSEPLGSHPCCAPPGPQEATLRCTQQPKSPTQIHPTYAPFRTHPQEAKAARKAGFKDGEALKKSSANFMSFFKVGLWNWVQNHYFCAVSGCWPTSCHSSRRGPLFRLFPGVCLLHSRSDRAAGTLPPSPQCVRATALPNPSPLMQHKMDGAPGSAAKPGAPQPTPSRGASQQPSQAGDASQQPAASGADAGAATGKREKGYAALFPKDSTNVVRWAWLRYLVATAAGGGTWGAW